MSRENTSIFFLGFFIALILLSIGYYIDKHKKYFTITVATPTLYTEPVSYNLTAEFSAYTLSADETDGDPCTGARSLNLCKLKPLLEERGLKICASRDLPLDTIISIEGIGDCIILDRMNIRYKGTGNIDILMDSKEVANDFGRKPLNYNIIN